MTRFLTRWLVNFGFTSSSDIHVAAETADEAVDIALEHLNKIRLAHKDDTLNRTHVRYVMAEGTVVVEV